MNTGSQDIEEYRQAITKIVGISKKLGDIEKHYLFLAGMREHTRMEDTLSSEVVEELFIETKWTGQQHIDTIAASLRYGLQRRLNMNRKI